MRFVSTRGGAQSASLKDALVNGLAPDGGLYMPEAIEPWSDDEIAALDARSLPELGARVLTPFAAGAISSDALRTIVGDAFNFVMPLVKVEPGVYALELFHGPTLAFKDVGARTMARLMAALHDGEAPLTVLVATSGDTGGAVAHAFHGVAHTRVVVLYPEGRVSPTQEAQLTMFNAVAASNVRAYAVAGNFDDCQRMVKEAFADAPLRARVRLTSANSINVGRLLPQMIYYFHAMAQLFMVEAAHGTAAATEPIFATPSGNFGNLTAGLMAKRSGLPIGRFVAATNANDVVPEYLDTGTYAPRASVQTLATAMDCGNPSNFERMLWLFGGSRDAMRHAIGGSRHADSEVRGTIARVYAERGYLLDPHSAIGYLGAAREIERDGRRGLEGHGTRVAVFLATAHPAKFSEIVEPIIGRKLDLPAPLAHALAQPKQLFHMPARLDALRDVL